MIVVISGFLFLLSHKPFVRFLEGRIDQDNQQGGNQQLHIQTQSGKGAQGGAAPYRSRSGEALDIDAPVQDHTRSQKADSRYDLADYPGRVYVFSVMLENNFVLRFPIDGLGKGDLNIKKKMRKIRKDEWV